MRLKKLSSVVLLIVLISGCSFIARRELTERFGIEQPRQRLVSAAAVKGHPVKYWQDIKPILDSRCVTCHSCYDSPCQFNLASVEGLDRGAHKSKVYADRLLAAPPMRLFVDAKSTSEWRGKDFYPMLNERIQIPEANLESSVLYRLLDLKINNPQPKTASLPSSFDLSLNWANQCPRIDELNVFEKLYPLWGMPYGFPGLTEAEHRKIRTWLELGALVETPAEIDKRLSLAIKDWEEFLNGESLKQQLVSRYIYEHLFLGELYFDEVNHHQYFSLVRSSTPPGEPLQEIATVRPTDDPNVPRVYYRLRPQHETIVSKTFMPYALNQSRMKRFRKLFIEPKYAVKALPSYEPKVATNPFKTYEQIPAKERYQFLLDEAEFFIMGFIKGPVCRGQTALNVINDQFWVFFVDPDEDPTITIPGFLEAQKHHLALPAREGSSALALTHWLEYSKKEQKYLKAKRDLLKKAQMSGKRTTEKVIWDGDKKNSNAALTVFRHHDSATVVRGLVGQDPKTAWLLGYPLFERIHYLLVTDFDVYGNVGHQLLTRLYMDFMRVEGENNFLLLLPTKDRKPVHDYWYRGIGGSSDDFALEYALSEESFDWSETGINFKTQSTKHELFEKLKHRIGKSLETRYSLKPKDAELLGELSELRGLSVSYLAETSLLRVRNGKQDQLFTLIHNKAHLNVAVLYLESLRREPEADTLTVVPGVLGAHPNIIFNVDKNELPAFIRAVNQLNSEDDYKALLDRFGIRRTNPDFWTHYDWVQQEQTRLLGFDAGILDLSRYENR